MKRRNRYRTRKKQPSLLRIFFVLFSISLFFLFGAWAWGALTADPLSQTPLLLKEGTLHFQGFRPDFGLREKGDFSTRFENGITATYTIDSSIQNRVKSYFEKYKVPYGSFVAMSPKTGKILALVDYSSRDPLAKDLSLRASYPAASIFKLITAAAALEEKHLSPDISIAYRGESNRLRPAYWKDNPRKDKFKMSISEAFAMSNNIVFAKVAYRWLDIPTLIDYGERFGFNRPIPFENEVEISHMKINDNEGELEKTAAGFGDVQLSPLHAALIGSAIANNGIMMAPCMVDSVTDPSGEKLYECTPKALNRVISSDTTMALREMMGKTVRNGTVRKVFRRRYRQRSIKKIKIGGKTGSLRGKNPRGRYTWFIGMAPLEDPEIVVAAMVVNDPVWHIMAPQVAKEGLTAYFDGLTK